MNPSLTKTYVMRLRKKNPPYLFTDPKISHIFVIKAQDQACSATYPLINNCKLLIILKY